MAKKLNPKFEWVIPLQKNLEYLKFQSAKFVFDQAEKQLLETLDASNSVLKKAQWLLGINTLICTGIGAVFLEKQEMIISCKSGVWGLLVPLFISCLGSLFVVWAQTFKISGSEPRNMKIGEQASYNEEECVQLIGFLMTSVIEYQNRIDHNKRIQKRNGIILNAAISLSSFSVLLGLSLFLTLCPN